MERKKSNTAEKKEEEAVDLRITYKKVGGGSARITIAGKPRIIPPGAMFKALPSEIPAAFKDVLIPMDREQEIVVTKKVEKQQPAPVKTVYNVVPHEDSELFDVVNGAGKAINGSPLSKEDADTLKQNLES